MGTNKATIVVQGKDGAISSTSVPSPNSDSVQIKEISPPIGVISLLTKGLPGLELLEKEEEVICVPR